ncbi:hypothetical protein BB561_000155 [Smittium simulii]|uniref:Tetrapyrrole biosynthesis uroporphyrinogen III synthase domain-containing protein n=1 Tax=Smittium simulii TaxID=133385 RepID=A0A2T9Z0D4_9FUNG|nr:hypothetical protein BB561_000155 [Smittium simulii]
MTRVILFRKPVVSKENPVDSYEKAFKEAGHWVCSIALLEHELLLTEADVLALLNSFESQTPAPTPETFLVDSETSVYQPFSSWILTSANAVSSLEKAVAQLFSRLKNTAKLHRDNYENNSTKSSSIKHKSDIDYAWFVDRLTRFLELQVFIVGPATCKKFTEKFSALYKLYCHTPPQFSTTSADNADMLVVLILDYAKQTNSNSFLHLCSNISLKTIPNALNSNHTSLQSKIAYKTIKRNDSDLLRQLETLNVHCKSSITDSIALRQFDHDTKLLTVEQSIRPIWACFFSPSGVDTIKQFTPNLKWWTQDTVNLAAIGKTTADQLLLHYSNHMVVAEHPTPEALLKAIQPECDDMQN